MALIDKLFPASYKGIGFLIRSGQTNAGRKTVVHEYPNSDRRFVEDLGKLQKIFTVEGIITSNTDNYFQERDALIAALESSERGILVHPFFGDQTVVATDYSLSENTTTLNEAAFTMTFVKADENIFPQEGGSNLSKINELRNDVLESVQNDIATQFKVDRLDSVNFGDAQVLLTALSAAFVTNIDKVTNDSDKISTFAAIARDFVANINPNIVDPISLASDYIGLFTGANTTAATALDQFDLFKLFFDFGDDDTEILPTTVSRIQRKKNRDLINTSTQISSLTQGYAAASQRTYGNNQQLLQTRADLENEYQKIIEFPLRDQTDTRLALTELRNEARIFFEAEAVNVPRLIDVKTRRQPLTTLVYSFYGNTENVRPLEALNQFDNPSFLQGDITILTENE